MPLLSFTKIQGIPSTARRTRKLAQDPKHLSTVYAGTTEGLYRSLDAGEHWKLLTGPDYIVNDIYIDPDNPDHVLLATDRRGVLVSENAGESFVPANSGFSARQILAYASDPHIPSHLYVGVVSDKETGGVYASTDGGVRWQQVSAGLSGRDVFSLGATEDGVVLAGTNHGIFRLQDGAWSDTGKLVAGARPEPTIVTGARPVPKAAHTAARKPAARVAAKKPAPAKAAPAKSPEGKAGEHLDELIYTIVRSERHLCRNVERPCARRCFRKYLDARFDAQAR